MIHQIAVKGRQLSVVACAVALSVAIPWPPTAHSAAPTMRGCGGHRTGRPPSAGVHNGLGESDCYFLVSRLGARTSQHVVQKVGVKVKGNFGFTTI